MSPIFISVDDGCLSLLGVAILHSVGVLHPPPPSYYWMPVNWLELAVNFPLSISSMINEIRASTSEFYFSFI